MKLIQGIVSARYIRRRHRPLFSLYEFKKFILPLGQLNHLHLILFSNSLHMFISWYCVMAGKRPIVKAFISGGAFYFVICFVKAFLYAA